ncbi:hypothetical protein K456DRAFT_363933, partial [Colletotrichum gloeosporioides 23]
HPFKYRFEFHNCHFVKTSPDSLYQRLPRNRQADYCKSSRHRQRKKKIKLLHNHLLINPAEAVLSRDQPGYQDLRRRIRSAIFESLIHEPSTYSTLYVFTDAQTANEAGTAVCQEYKDCADRRGCEFIPITLDCDEQTNLGRLIEGGRHAEGKLIDAELLKMFRDGEDLYDFEEHPHRLRIDVSHLSPQVAASKILGHVVSVCSDDTCSLITTA